MHGSDARDVAHHRRGADLVAVDRPHQLWRIPKTVPAYPLRDLSDVPPADVVLSLAATADQHEAIEDPAAAYENGVRVLVHSLEFAKRVGARLLDVSNNEVFGV